MRGEVVTLPAEEKTEFPDQREELVLSATCNHLMCKVSGCWLGRVGHWLPWCSRRKVEFCWISERHCHLIIRTSTVHLLENVSETFMGCPQVSWGLGLLVLVPLWRHKIQPFSDQGRRTFWHAEWPYPVSVSENVHPNAESCALGSEKWHPSKQSLLGMVWWVAWEKSMDCFLPLKMVCFLLVEKIELHSNKDAAIAEVFVLGEG